MEFLIIPLQEKLEDWKKTVLNLDKEHAKGKPQTRNPQHADRNPLSLLRLQKGKVRIEKAVHRHAAPAEEDAKRRRRRSAEEIRVRPAGRHRETSITGRDRKARRQGGPHRGAGPLLHVRRAPQTRRGKNDN